MPGHLGCGKGRGWRGYSPDLWLQTFSLLYSQSSSPLTPGVFLPLPADCHPLLLLPVPSSAPSWCPHQFTSPLPKPSLLYPAVRLLQPQPVPWRPHLLPLSAPARQPLPATDNRGRAGQPRAATPAGTSGRTRRLEGKTPAGGAPPGVPCGLAASAQRQCPGGASPRSLLPRKGCLVCGGWSPPGPPSSTVAIARSPRTHSTRAELLAQMVQRY